MRLSLKVAFAVIFVISSCFDLGSTLASLKILIMTSQTLPDMHYITEPQRAQLYPAVTRIHTIPSIPSTFPFKAPQTPPRARGPRYTIGWLEFQSPEQPDPEVARPGDIWIQLPLGHRKARVYACYTREGRDWSPWVGNATSISDRTLVRTHPFLNSDHAQRRFYLVFNGREFVWANIKAISNIEHNHPQIAKMGPADAVAKWLEVSGKRGGPRKAKEVSSPEKNSGDQDTRPLSAPPPNRKHARFESLGPTGESASAPPAKRSKSVPRDQPPSPSDPSPTVRSGPYAKAGATQVGWVMYINGVPLNMPTACLNCARDKTQCSGLPGERCGRCRFKKRSCSHSNSGREKGTAEPETKEGFVASPVAPKPKSVLRGASQKPKPSTKVGNGADATNTRSSGSSRPAAVFRPILSACLCSSVNVMCMLTRGTQGQLSQRVVVVVVPAARSLPSARITILTQSRVCKMTTMVQSWMPQTTGMMQRSRTC